MSSQWTKIVPISVVRFIETESSSSMIGRDWIRSQGGVCPENISIWPYISLNWLDFALYTRLTYNLVMLLQLFADIIQA